MRRTRNPTDLVCQAEPLAPTLQDMRCITTAAGMQRRALQWRARATPVALVPTMGCLHEGHLSLVRVGRRRVGAEGQVVVSIFVNPIQFGPAEDLASYPRDLGRDRRLCREAGVDVLFVPGHGQMYPAGGGQGEGFSTYVVEEDLARRMEGVSRPTHFRGVTTVVAKLFNLVLPSVAVFGAKDFQQAAVVRRMARDLNFPLRILVSPTVRERDGLAMSSRNRYLSPAQRRQATVLWRAIQAARERIAGAKTGIPAARLRRQLARWMAREPEARLDYIEFFEPGTLRPVTTVRRGIRMALAVFIGRTRLIDNASL